MLFISESSCSRVLSLSSWWNFPTVFPEFCKMLLRCRIFCRLNFAMGVLGQNLFNLFSCRNFLSYSTKISEYCVLKSDLGYLLATSVSG